MSRTRSIALALLALSPVTTLAAEGLFEEAGSLREGRHDRYIAPLVNPLFNETPYITTEARALYMGYELPNDFITGGGSIDVYALELRLALSDRLGFIASKDGYADIDFDGVLPDESGFANVSAGLKYAVIDDPEQDTIVTVGVEYEIPVGNLETAGINLQGDGDGFLDVFVSAAGADGRFGYQTSLGYNYAIDDKRNSSALHYSAHLNYEMTPRFYPIAELNGITVVDDGDRTPVDFEGFDLVNFGSTDAGTVVTLAFGGRFLATKHVQLGFGYEFPISDDEDIIDRKIYLDLVWHR